MKDKSEAVWSTGGYEGLAKAIISQAAHDLMSNAKTCDRQGSRESITGSARQFFRSDWFEVLADDVGYHAEHARRHLAGAGLI